MNFDQDSIRDRMTQSLSQKTSWQDVLFFSVNNYLVNLISAEIANLASHDEFLTRETKWNLAQNLSSLIHQADFRGYDIKRKKGSTGDIRVSISEDFINASEWSGSLTYSNGDKVIYEDKMYQANTDSPAGTPDTSGDWDYVSTAHTSTITIPKYTIFSTNGGVQFACNETKQITVIEDYKDIPVTQGVPKEYTQIPDGDDFEIITVYNDSFEDTIYDVYVNDELYTEISDIRSASEDEKVYQTKTLDDFSGVEFIFGDGNFGKKLEVVDFVKIKYLETSGLSGNISSANLVNQINSTVYDSTDTPVTLYVKNESALSGGEGADSLEEIRTKGTNTFQAGQRSVAAPDYSVLLAESNLVKKATVWGAYEQDRDNGVPLWTWIDTTENLVYASVITPDGSDLTDSQKDEIIESIKDIKPPTDILSFVDVEYVDLAFNINAKVGNTSYVLSEVQNDIIDLLEEKFSIDELDFKEAIYETYWKGLISGVDGVTYHTSTVELIYFSTFNTSAYESNIALPTYPIEAGTISIYLKNNNDAVPSFKKIAVDDGAGGFTPEVGYTFSAGSSIDYNTGQGFFKVTSGLTDTYTDYEIKIYYTLESLDLELQERNHIFRFSEVKSIEVSYID